MSACVQQTGGRVRRGAAYYRSISAARDSGTRSMSDVTHSGAVSKLLVTNAWSCARNQRRSIHTKPTGEGKKPPRIRTAVGRSGRTSVVVGAETRTRTRIRKRVRTRVSARGDGAGKGRGLLTEVLAHGRDVEQRLDAELGEQRLVPDACPEHKQTRARAHQPSRRCTPRPASDSPDSSSSCGVCSVPVQTHQKKTPRERNPLQAQKIPTGGTHRQKARPPSPHGPRASRPPPRTRRRARRGPRFLPRCAGRRARGWPVRR